MSWQSAREFVRDFGPFFSAMALIAGAAAAWFTYLYYNRASTKADWFEAFTKLYQEFWNSKDMAKMRRYIVSEGDYSKIEPIFIKRLSEVENKMSADENDFLESVDKFCALMIIALAFSDSETQPYQKALYEPLFTHWIATMKRRQAMMRYIETYWKPLYARIDKR